jgi:hypothetical protein
MPGNHSSDRQPAGFMPLTQPSSTRHPAAPTVANPVDRHLAVVARTLSWADEAADRGDHHEALAWVAVIETVDGLLPASYTAKRDAWRRARDNQPSGPLMRRAIARPHRRRR